MNDLPALRSARFYNGLHDLDLTARQRVGIIELFQECFERGIRRMGSTCPTCYQQVRFDGGTPRCPDHGPIFNHRDLPMAVAFDPVPATGWFPKETA